MKKGWLRLHGNAAGRRRPYWAIPFFCDGCQRKHGPYIERTLTLDKKLLCNRQYERHQEQLFKDAKRGYSAPKLRPLRPARCQTPIPRMPNFKSLQVDSGPILSRF